MLTEKPCSLRRGADTPGKSAHRDARVPPALMPVILLCVLLALSGCDERQYSPAEQVMRSRWPDSTTARILTDEAGNRYIVKKSVEAGKNWDISPILK